MKKYIEINGEKIWDFGTWGGDLSLESGECLGEGQEPCIFHCCSGTDVVVSGSGAVYRDGNHIGQITPEELEGFTSDFMEQH
jgi:hypothetical protein